MRSVSRSAAAALPAGRPWRHLPWTLLLLAGAAACLLSLPVHAQWKWLDQRGQVNISDLPPPRSVPEKDILDRPKNRPMPTPTLEAAPLPASAASAALAASAPATKTALETEVEKRRKTAEAEAEAKAKAEEAKLAAQRKDNCARARTHMTTLESGIRIVRYNPKGEQEVLDDRQRADETRRTRDIIASDCR